MNKSNLILLYFFFTVLVSNSFEPLDVDFLKQKKEKKIVKPDEPPKPSQAPKKSEFPSFDKVIKDFELIPGLFDLYWDKDKNKFLISIEPEQFDKVYLANLTRKSGDGQYYDSGSQLWEFPYIFEKLSNTVQMVHVNTSFRADKSSAIYRSLENFSNSIVSTGKVVSMPHLETGAILIDATEMFLTDVSYVSQNRKGQYRFDKKNSFISDLQSFPTNTEIQMKLHFKSAKWTNSITLPNSHSMMHTYHISLLDIPNTDFKPRVADDRLGYFTTIYQDYTSTLKETPYVRYINRWNLKKKYPDREMSEPVEPIVYWLENTIPEEFRQAVKDGVLAWNKAFEKIGFKNAIVAKQMPDDATWHPGDARYNTIRWIVQPQRAYAVGPSRANPYTGEIYDADIRIAADFTRAFYREYDEFAVPVTSDDPISMWESEELNQHEHKCNYAENLQQQMILSWHSLTSQGYLNNSDSDLQDYIYQGLVDLVLHEVGHTLGLRHNFKASSIYTVEQLSDPKFTNQMGISGSVMDYHPVSLLDNGNSLFQIEPGPYDDWAIEYGYSQCSHTKGILPAVYQDNQIPINNENTCLESIANRSNEPYLAYGTDEDAFGLSSRGIDPLCNVWDIGKDPVEFYDKQLDLVQKLWENLIDDFEKKGSRFQKLRSVFSQGIGEYYSAYRTAAKFIGGIHFSRNHIGDPGQKNPLVVVSGDQQRKALQFINNRILHKNAFNFDQNLLNKLSPERYDDFNGYVWSMDRLDYPLHTIIKRIQSNALFSVFHPRRILRLQDNELRTLDSNPFTMVELFETVNTMIWEELDSGENINSYRRELQESYIDLMRVIVLDIYNTTTFPNDAKILARSNLKKTLKNIYFNLGHNTFDDYTKAHLENVAENIESIIEAKIDLN